MSSRIIELETVSKQYEVGDETVQALQDVDFAVDPGEMVSVMGPSGSGKSTMLNLIGLLDTPTDGTVRHGGRDVSAFDESALTEERRSGIGFIFQEFHLLPTLSATENVELPSMWNSGTNRHARARDLLQRMGLGDRLDHRPDQLSGGQRQRVAIARSLKNEPHIVLADEPTGNLDQTTGRTILKELERIKNEDDVSIVAVTHDPMLSEFTDRTVELLDGVIQ